MVFSKLKSMVLLQHRGNKSVKKKKKKVLHANSNFDITVCHFIACRCPEAPGNLHYFISFCVNLQFYAFSKTTL